VSVSENWGFAVFDTGDLRLVVDEDAMTACQLFDVRADPTEDHNLVDDPAAADALGALMHDVVTPFFSTAAARPHPSPFTG
jgi:arylsulfatase A-like enzyme